MNVMKTIVGTWIKIFVYISSRIISALGLAEELCEFSSVCLKSNMCKLSPGEAYELCNGYAYFAFSRTYGDRFR